MSDVNETIRAAVWEANASLEVNSGPEDDTLEIIAVLVKVSRLDAKGDLETVQNIHWDSRAI